MKWPWSRPALPTINFTQHLGLDCPICHQVIRIEVDMLQKPGSAPAAYDGTYTGLEFPAHRCGTRSKSK